MVSRGQRRRNRGQTRARAAGMGQLGEVDAAVVSAFERRFGVANMLATRNPLAVMVLHL